MARRNSAPAGSWESEAPAELLYPLGFKLGGSLALPKGTSSPRHSFVFRQRDIAQHSAGRKDFVAGRVEGDHAIPFFPLLLLLGFLPLLLFRLRRLLGIAEPHDAHALQGQEIDRRSGNR